MLTVWSLKISNSAKSFSMKDFVLLMRIFVSVSSHVCLLLTLQERMAMAMRLTIRTTVRFVSRVEKSSYVTLVQEHITWSV